MDSLFANALQRCKKYLYGFIVIVSVKFCVEKWLILLLLLNLNDFAIIVAIRCVFNIFIVCYQAKIIKKIGR